MATALGRAGLSNGAVSALVSVPGRAGAGTSNVQRDLAADVRRTLTTLDVERVQLALAMMYTATLPQITQALAAITNDRWIQMMALVPDALTGEGGARIHWAKYRNGTILAILERMPDANRRSFNQWLGRPARQALANSIRPPQVTGETQFAVLNDMFASTPDDELPALNRWFELRWGFRAEASTEAGDTGRAFTANGLRRSWNVFGSLPPQAVRGNRSMLRYVRYDGGDGSGYYSDDARGVVAVSYDDLRTLDTAGNAGAASPLIGQNQFDETVRHEVGHAVDRKLRLHQTYCIGNVAGGNWRQEATATVAATMVAASAGGAVNTLPAPQKAAVIGALNQVVANRAPDSTRSYVNRALRRLIPARRARDTAVTAVMGDPAVQQLQICFARRKDPGNPWYRSDESGGITVGNRIFQESYRNDWWSYQASTRSKRVSLYQFRAPYEWMAEAYNAYYCPPTKGAKLDAKDHDTKVWFDTNVDQATGGAGAAGAGPPLPSATSGPGFP